MKVENKGFSNCFLNKYVYHDLVIIFYLFAFCHNTSLISCSYFYLVNRQKFFKTAAYTFDNLPPYKNILVQELRKSAMWL